MRKLKNFIRHQKTRFQEFKLRKKSVQAIFEKIYEDGIWGGSSEPNGPFNSGSGSDLSIIKPYVDVISKYINDNAITTVADLGCGDFRVGYELVNSTDIVYIGIDVVRPLIENLNKKYSTPKTRFLCKDITDEDIPEADLYLIRQVFQHLSNDKIMTVLAKLRSKRVMITEHIPGFQCSKPNLDKKTGPGIRLYKDSGLFLEQAPFSLPLKILLETPQEFNGKAGILRTSLGKL